MSVTWSPTSNFNVFAASHPSNVQQNLNTYETLQKWNYTQIQTDPLQTASPWSGTLPLSSGRGVSSIGLPWDLNCEELCDLFCLAFLTDFRENPSTLSTDGGVVGAEDISLLKRKRCHQQAPKRSYRKDSASLYNTHENNNTCSARKQTKLVNGSPMSVVK